MCFKFTQQPDPPFPVLKRIHFSPNLPMSCQFNWAVSATRLHSPNYVHFHRASFASVPGKRDSVYKSFEGSLLSISLHILYLSWGPSSHIHQGLLPSQINRHTIALQQGLQGCRERQRSYQTAWVHLCFPPGYDYQPQYIFLRWLRPILFQMTSKGQCCHCILEEIASCTEEEKRHSEMW